MITFLETVEWMSRLISIAIILQTIEILQLRPLWKDQDGIWSYINLKQEYPKCLHFILKEKGFTALLYLQIFASIVNIFYFNIVCIVILFVITFWISIRWRGTFNGGSDYMTLIVVIVLLVIKMSPSEKIRTAALWYAAVQFIFSYFIAGLAKLKDSNWRKGSALPALLDHSKYIVPSFVKRTFRVPRLGLIASWLIISFELMSPLALTSKTAALVFIGLSLFFHIGNFIVFGLNRFVWAWAAVYPALYFLAIH